EPIVRPHRFGELDNVLLAPHSIAHTHELFRDIGRAVCRGMLELARGRRPAGVLNPEVFDRPSFQAKWRRLRPGSRKRNRPSVRACSVSEGGSNPSLTLQARTEGRQG